MTSLQLMLSTHLSHNLIKLFEDRREVDDPQLVAIVANYGGVGDDAQVPDEDGGVAVAQGHGPQHLALGDVPQVEATLTTGHHQVGGQHVHRVTVTRLLGKHKEKTIAIVWNLTK